jgi:hypothetical protein
LLISLLLFPGIAVKAQELRFSSSEIRNLEKQSLITRERPDTWKTRGGLIISGYDRDGETRLEHILEHMHDKKGKNKHGVFTVGSDKVIILMDTVWAEAQSGNLKPSHTGARSVYIYDAGNRTGYLGGRDGAKKGYPVLRKVRLVLEGTTPRVVTFYPI